ncbi:hypothetical protein [Sinorhizobium sp. CCBAU 05631]|uniref:hypothetical protein n=1 Tax=Sinorhizobium sp. CCBAU 05631 TaxID=794846 RepID=UPI0004B19D62|nr:hypothetical protein [Sinorhizobium sp. CCBAU 05631]ASY56495.1 Phage protein [Sinorhizobium sp. CCBAU 05631]
MADIITWPICVLRPQQSAANLVPFNRSGGRSLGGLEPTTRTDLGFWAIDYGNVVMQNRRREQWQTWQAIRQKLGGRTGLIAVPVRVSLSAPYASGEFEPFITVPHDDDAPFDDDSEYEQGAISIVTDGVTPLGATTIRLRIINAAANLVGVRFSYEHAFYETGPVISIDGDIWTLPISPSVRALIPAGADLEFDRPTCLCRLADDRGMDVNQDAVGKTAFPPVSFVEAVDYWNSLVA